MKNIILASQSPRRKQLLQWAEVPFEIIVSETDEAFPENMNRAEIPIHIARGKALAVQNSLDGSWNTSYSAILAADTIVVHNSNVIGKPKDREDAIRILSTLSGDTHQVITGVVIIDSSGKEYSFSDLTEVSFHTLVDSQIEFYVDKYKPYDKAGAYAIQEWIGVTGIKSIHGDFYNVMGLPVSRVVKILSELR